MAKDNSKQIAFRLAPDDYDRLAVQVLLKGTPSMAEYVKRLVLADLAANTEAINDVAAAVARHTGAGTFATASNNPTQSPAPSVSVDDTDSAPEGIEGKLAQIPTPVVEFEGEPEAVNAAAEGIPIPEAQKKSPRENAENSENLTGSAVSTYSQEFAKAVG